MSRSALSGTRAPPTTGRTATRPGAWETRKFTRHYDSARREYEKGKAAERESWAALGVSTDQIAAQRADGQSPAQDGQAPAQDGQAPQPDSGPDSDAGLAAVAALYKAGGLARCVQGPARRHRLAAIADSWSRARSTPCSPSPAPASRCSHWSGAVAR